MAGPNASGGEQRFTYVVVGAGSAGCVLANRLSENPANTVCLIEAGPADRSPLIHVPLGVMRLINHPRLNWNYATTPQAHAGGRSIAIPRGKTLGGSSSINGMVYTRGHPSDYDDWARLGNPGWSFREVLPYFRRSENNRDFRDSVYHGTDGPLQVGFLDQYNPLSEIFFQAGEALQYRRNADFCGETHEGFGRRQASIAEGRRSSASTAYLAPARKRPNLHILTGALARRVVIEDGRATGVEIEIGGAVRTIRADGEVILSAGAMGSPHLLLLSGVGDAEELRESGIAPRHHLPGVGRNLQDHIAAAVQYTSPTTAPYGLSWKSLPWLAWNVVSYPFTGRGLLANNILHSGAFVRSLPGLDRPDVQLILVPAIRDRKGRMGRGFGFGVLSVLLRPKSTGRVFLHSPDPKAAPGIDPDFFAETDDIETIVRGLRIARRLVDTAPFAPYRGAEIDPGREVESAEGMAAYVREKSHTAYHPVGTCAMGPGKDAVVDATLKVHGISGLRVADASIMPTLLGGNTNGPAIMVGEKAADLILGRPALPADDLPQI
ncbi:MAG: GMC family oxidoreductase N-terminal domain-containing protein [Rhizobiaceae bacterium]